MKRMIIGTVLSFLLATFGYIYETNAGMSYCEQADKAARSEDRNTINPKGSDQDGKQSYHQLLDIDECDANGHCVIYEGYRPCGGVMQLFDADQDGDCDYTVEWHPIVDPTFGVFYTIFKVSRCPLTA